MFRVALLALTGTVLAFSACAAEPVPIEARVAVVPAAFVVAVAILGALALRDRPGLRRTMLALAIATIAVVPMAAMAQVAAPAPVPVDASSPVLWALSAALTSLVALIAWAANRYLGITMAQADREALHSAMMTGARAVIDRIGSRSASLDQAAPAEVVQYVRQSVPDALTRLAPGLDVLETMAAAKISEALSAKVARL